MSSTTQARVIPSTTTSVKLIGDNPARQGLNIMNNSSEVLYLRFEVGPASSTNPTVRVPAYFLYEAPLNRGGQPFTGVVYGVWASANGQAVVTEIP